ncbi:hypothetical protein A4H97_21095 [Niastella yeongjuensis]|uniref:Peptidase M50 domain-containing protein n=3 Tax=Niastella yeongjuensis TaxID=354355 RepID=A0A1V9FCR8_9BACT|nr:hypothetical protein A4H97_21095 [Niastella yeongjuensis]SEP23860.1 hypothetical protein SAMN05660816_04855 [Niastella yeongjuensis]
MLLLNYNAFLLGAIIFLAISLSNFIYVWLCKIWKVRILEFSIFLNPWFSLLKRNINGVVYKLGWIPMGAYIKPLGMTEEELKDIPAEELPFSFSGKPRTLKVLFRFAPILVLLFVLLISLFTLKGPGNLFQAISEMYNYMAFAIKVMFDAHLKSEFVTMTNNMLVDKNIVSFALVIMITVYLVINLFSTLYAYDEKKDNKLSKLVSFIVIIFAAYLTFWKIPVFVISFFSLRQNITYLVSFFLGLYLIGVLIFMLVMFLIKLTTTKS